MALQAFGWILIIQAALKDHLGKSGKAIIQIRKNGQFGYFAFVLYTLCAVIAFWFPLTIAVITTLIWIFWLILGINMKQE